MEKADKILNALFERLHVHDEQGYARLFSTWQTACGEVSSRGLADHSSIVDVRKGTLVVAVDHPGWMQIIQMHEKKLLHKLQERFPDMGLKAIHFHVSDRRVDFLSRTAERTQTSAPESHETGSRQEKSEDSHSPQADHRKSSDGTSGPGGSSAPDADSALDRIENEQLRRTLERLQEDLEERE